MEACAGAGPCVDGLIALGGLQPVIPVTVPETQIERLSDLLVPRKSKPPSFLQLAARADVERLLKSRAAGQMTCSQARFERNRIGIAPKSRESPTSSCVEAEEEASSGC